MNHIINDMTTPGFWREG